MHLAPGVDRTPANDALAERYGGRAGLDTLLGDLDRRLRRTWAPCRSRHRAWTWEAADRRDPRWWPQGVSVADDERHVAVSWYAKGGGSRVTFADLEARRYRHVELVVATEDGHDPLRVHAGGLAWDGPRLYVAATRAGLWVCDTSDIVRARDAYLLPVRHQLSCTTETGVPPFRFSFVSVDHISEPPQLLAGEYDNAGGSCRLARVALDGGPMDVEDVGVRRAQGAVSAGGRYYLTASQGTRRLGSLWTGRPGALRERRHALPMGPEDLAWSARSDRLWTVTEHPRRRWLLSLPRPTGG